MTKLAGTNAGRVADLRSREIGGIDLDQRQIFFRVARDHLSFEAATVAQDDLQRVAPPAT